MFTLGLGWLYKQTGFDVADPTRMSRAGSRRPAASRSSPSPAAPGGNDPGNSVLKYQWYDFYVERKRSISLGKNYVGSSFFLEGRIKIRFFSRRSDPGKLTRIRNPCLCMIETKYIKAGFRVSGQEYCSSTLI